MTIPEIQKNIHINMLFLKLNTLKQRMSSLIMIWQVTAVQCSKVVYYVVFTNGLVVVMDDITA